MTPADHGYVQCSWCGTWRRPERIDMGGGCVERDLCAATDARRQAAWVDAARDWHTDSCLTRQAEGEACNCRPWTEGAP